jgi:protein-L-isoaspartate(D-aspartate) O-methyltransferase
MHPRACLPLLLFAAAFAPRAAVAQRDPTYELRQRMVHDAIVAEGVSNQRVIESMRITPRHEFVPTSLRHMAYYDMALPIGQSQTISPPYVVAYMTEALDPQPTDKVLELGTGSGYQAAVLSPLVAEVYTIEIVEELGRRAAQTLKRLKYINVFTLVGDGYQGWPEHAPFDKIIVTCSPEKIPKPLVDQLAEGGRLLIPLGERYQQTLYLYIKKDGKLVEEALLPVVFVPMTGQAEATRQVQPDPARPKLVNGGFEEVLESGRAVGWYYQRQMALSSEGKVPGGKQYVVFTNEQQGRGAHALQAFGIDGRKVKELIVTLSVRGTNVRPGIGPREVAAVQFTFYDSVRKTVSMPLIGDWRGSFGWTTVNTRVPISQSVREGIVHIGMLGATGEVCFDNVEIEAVPREP